MAKDSHLPNQSELPLVSVCIPAYNSEATLGETLEAVLAQDYPRLDIVVSDNQSIDRTKTIVQQYAGRGVRYCWHSEGRPAWAATMPNYVGGFANWNFVLSQGRGDYLCLFHSDDLYEPSIVRQQAMVMQTHPRVGAVFTQARMIGEDSRPIRMGTTSLPKKLRGHLLFDLPSLLNALLEFGNFLPTPSVMLRRSVLEELGGFDERQFLTSADLEMWLRIACHGYQLAIIDEPLLWNRVSAQQGSAQVNKARVFRAHFFVVMDYHLSMPEVCQHVKPEALLRHEMYSISDDIVRGTNMALQGGVKEAKALLESACVRPAFRAGLLDQTFLRQFSLGIVLLVAFRLGMGRLASWVYSEAIRLWRTERKLQPISSGS